MNWDIVELLADHFGYIPEKITDIGENLFEIDDTDEDNGKQKLFQAFMEDDFLRAEFIYYL